MCDVILQIISVLLYFAIFYTVENQFSNYKQNSVKICKLCNII